MPNKGDTKDIEITPIKVGVPRTFGDNGQAFPVTVAEDITDRFEVYAEAGANALKAALNTKIAVTISYINQYQGTDQWKITKVPGWEQGQGGGKGGRNWSPRLDHPNQRAEALVAEAFKVAGSNLNLLAPVDRDRASVQDLIALGSQVADAMVEMSLEIAKRLPASAPSGGSGTPGGDGNSAGSAPGSAPTLSGPDLRPDLWPALVEAFRTAYTAAGIGKDDAEGRSKFMADTLKPIADRWGWPYPPTLETLTETQHATYIQAFSNAIVAGIGNALA